MSHRCLAAVLTVIAVVALTPIFAAAQSANTTTTLRTAWEQPDLQGVWDFRTITPLQRPEELADQEFLTAEEAANLEQEAVACGIRPPGERRRASASAATTISGWTGEQGPSGLGARR